MSQAEEYDNEKLEQLAQSVKPARTRSKKGKKFADTQYMLSLVEQVNKQQEAKIQTLLEHEAELLKRIVGRDRKRSQTRETKKDKIAKVKEGLRNGKKSAVAKGKGDHRKPEGADESKAKDLPSKKSKKKVHFKS